MQGKIAYIRPKVVGPFPVRGATDSYVHRAALLFFAGQSCVYLLSTCHVRLEGPSRCCESPEGPKEAPHYIGCKSWLKVSFDS
jgi:hypothetical protein